METSKKIRLLLVEREMTIKELAAKIGLTGGNLSNKLTRNNFPENELRKIADALDCDFECVFTKKEH